MTKQSKNILIGLIIAFFIIPSTQFSNTRQNIQNWQQHILKIIPAIGTQGDSDFQNSKLQFIHQKTKKLIYSYDLDNNKILEMRIERMKNLDALILLTFSGGESGGTISLIAFTLENNKIIKNKELEFTGYSNVNFKNIGNDKNKSVLLDSIRFQNRDFGCFTVPLIAIIGSSKLYYPQIYSLKGNEFVKEPISIKLKNIFQPYFNETEKLLVKNKGITIDNAKNMEHNFVLFNILEYYYNLTKLNGQKRALSNIEKSQMRISCRDGKIISLADFFKRNTSLILSL